MFGFLQENRDFRNFWFGQVISQIGDRIHTLAVIWLVYSWTKSGTALGLVLIAATLPSVLVSPWAGALSDRLNRKQIAIGCDGVRSVLVIVLATLGIGGAILEGASLSYLGLGAQPMTPEWGSMLSAGRGFLTNAWWVSVFPGLGIFLAILSINLIGDGLGDVLDPIKK